MIKILCNEFQDNHEIDCKGKLLIDNREVEFEVRSSDDRFNPICLCYIFYDRKGDYDCIEFDFLTKEVVSTNTMSISQADDIINKIYSKDKVSLKQD